jgi:hypothetical protein
MHYTDIAAEILKLGLKREVGATPAATVAANIYSSLKREKEKDRLGPARKIGHR